MRLCQMLRLGVPQERIALCLQVMQQTISNHSPNRATWPKPVNTEQTNGFTVAVERFQSSAGG